MVSSAGTTPYTYDAADRLLSAGTTSNTYDGNGNQITKTTGTTTTNFIYDPLNRLIGASGGGINSGYQYDGDGNRVGQTVPTGTYQYQNDTASRLPVVLSESGPDGNIDYLYGHSLVSETSSAFQYFYQTDGLGSAASLTDGTGSLKATYSFDPWGKLLTPVDPLGTKNKYKFTSEALDPGTGLYYLRARVYDPTLGRLLAKDPKSGFINLPTSLNRYSYALSNPTSLRDPSGQSSIDTEASGQLGNMGQFTTNLTNTNSTEAFASGATECSAECVSNLVDFLGTVVGAAATFGPGVAAVANVVPFVQMPFELESQFSSGASRITALKNVFFGQLVNTGIPLAITELAGASIGAGVAVGLYAFNYDLPVAQ
jgi:RHS repeat-associated protein